MKYWQNALIVCCLLIGMASCKKSDLTTYQQSKADIYFSTTIPANTGRVIDPVDSVNASLAYVPPGQDFFIKILVKTTGLTGTVDHPFKVVATTASTAVAGTHYEALPDNFIFHAGKIEDTLTVKIMRTADMKTKTFVLQLELQPNEYFTTNLQHKLISTASNATINCIRYRINITDRLIQPFIWGQPAVATSYLGPYSATKMFLIAQILQFDPSYFNSTDITVSEALYWGTAVQRYLNDQKSLGNIILDENGKPMIMGSKVQ